jgi:putative DNA primase/helicase
MDSPPLSDSEIIEKLYHSKRGAEFRGLFDNGSTEDHSSGDLTLCSMIGFYTQDSEQIDQIFRGSALYRDKWERVDYRTTTINRALEGLTATWQPPQHVEGQHYGLTESEAARRFTDSDLAEGFKVLRLARQPWGWQYNEASGIWRKDNHNFELKKSVRTISKIILSEMADEPDPGRRDKLFALAKKLETRRGLDDIAGLVLMDLPEFLPDASNTKDNTLCVANGVVYMPLGKLWPHGEEHQFTLQSPVTYDTEAECPLWVKFIAELCCDDVDLIRFIQSWSGYCCSGYVNEQKMAVFYGRGQNGKSVYLEVMKHILGGFAATTPADTLLQRKSEQSNDLAALEYVRFVSAIESDEGQSLAEGRIKSLTGGDEIVCRKLFEEYRTFTPRFKLNLATNSKPRVNGTDFGIWRRLLLIPCKAEIHNPDKHLLEKLKTEAPGILNWLVQGFQRWQAEGLVIPACIVTATQEYRAECDTVGRFLDGVCNPYEDSINHHDGIQASVLYKAYSAWCLAEGHKPFSNVRFSQKMAEHGFPSYKKTGGMFYTHALKIGAR